MLLQSTSLRVLSALILLTPLYECDGGMLQRNLLYTAVTRPKKMILLGERTATDIASILIQMPLNVIHSWKTCSKALVKKVNLRQLRLLGINNLEAMLLKLK